jgi:hypothetical protein
MNDEEELDQPEELPSDPVTYYDRLPDSIKAVFDDILKFRVDPAGQCYNVTLDHIVQSLQQLDTKNVVAINDILSSTHEERGHMYDPILRSFIQGCGGQLSNWDKEEKSMTPVVLRGITKRKAMWACEQAGRDFYYIDTGYFGNGKKKTYHRITKNAVQNFGPIIDRPGDRLSQTRQKFRKFRKEGGRILLAPPSQKLLAFYNIDLNAWMDETIAEIKQHTDREIVIRLKQGRSTRVNDDTIEMALEQDIYCLVTYSSIAAGEALLLGKPAITLGPNAAAPLCSQNLAEIENLNFPTVDEVQAWARHLSYCQFTVPEMENGTAWRILNDT